MKTPGRSATLLEILMFITALGGIALALLAGFLFGLMGFTAVIETDGQTSLSALWSMAGMLALAVSLVPAAYWSGRAVFGAPAPERGRPAAGWLLAILAYPVCLFLGSLAQTPGMASIVLGPLALAGTACLSILVIGWLVRRLGPAISPLRAWGHFTVGITAMPLGALILELAALVPILAVFGIWILTAPEGRALAQVLQQASPDPERALSFATDLLKSPLVLVGVYGYAALVIPLIEETLKTMAVWPFLRRGLPGNEAFLGGALGGAGYALFEALFLTQPGDVWVATTFARVGASLLHIFTAALTSWGLMEGVRRRRYAVAAGTFLVAICMHGLWNLAAVTIGIASLPIGPSPSPMPDEVSSPAMLLLVSLVLVAGLGLVLSWRRLARSEAEAT